jgi:RNA polymerase sigma-70 factor (ECF subfamily)
MHATTPPEQRPPATDAELVARWLQGDQAAVHELAERYYRPVCGFLLKRVQRPDLVEDLAQETFLEAVRSVQSLHRPEQFASWLFGIAHNRCGKWLRRPRLTLFSAREAYEQIVAPETISAQEDWEEQQKRLAVLERGLADLPEETRTLLDLKHRQGKTCEQIAQEVGRPAGTVKSLLSRAYKTLRVRLRRLGDDS